MTRPVLLALAALAITLAALPWAAVDAQDAALPGVRGSLYESPSSGWILIVPEPDWRVAHARSEDGLDAVHLVSDQGDGADTNFASFPDDGRGSRGCVEDTLTALSEAFPGQAIEGWHAPEVAIDEFGPGEHTANARIVDPADPALDLMASISCIEGEDGLLIAETLLRTARDLESGAIPPTLAALLPGNGHTGRARGDGEARIPETGVVRFLFRADSPLNPYPFPFSCIDQESFERPAEPPPPGMGYFACDGQIANIDIVPATIDLADLALGCESVPDGEAPPPNCPATPIRPSYAEIIRAPAAVNGSVLTLQPGESAEVVLWYALPEGDPPLDVLYLEPDRRVIAGPTYFSAGIGSRPKVRVGR